MADGYFGTGLAAMERAAAMRRKPSRAPDTGAGSMPRAGIPAVTRDRDRIPAGQTAMQAAQDMGILAEALIQARRSQRPELYEPFKRKVLPVLVRSAARAVAAARGLPVDQAIAPAQQLTRGLIAHIEGGIGDKTATNAAAPADRDEGMEALATAGHGDRPGMTERARSSPVENAIYVRPEASPTQPKPPEVDESLPSTGRSKDEMRPRQSPEGPDQSLEETLRRLRDPDYMNKLLQDLRDRASRTGAEQLRRESERLKGLSNEELIKEYIKQYGPPPEPDFWEKYILPYLPRFGPPATKPLPERAYDGGNRG